LYKRKSFLAHLKKLDWVGQHLIQAFLSKFSGQEGSEVLQQLFERPSSSTAPREPAK
jgi:hypothetical protein